VSSQRRGQPGAAGRGVPAVATGSGDRNGYTYAAASKASPEMRAIWHDGYFVAHFDGGDTVH
jgi:hypothetical protein